MKTTFTLVIFLALSLITWQAYSNTNKGGEKKDITVGSDRKTGDIELHFAAGLAGKALITILDESGKTMLQQTFVVTNSTNIIPLKNATGLTEGPYIVRLVSNHKTYTTRFMIWK